MRRSGWIPFLTALLIVAASAGYPLCAAIFRVAWPAEEALSLPDNGLLKVSATTAAWAISVATVALFIGWWPGRLLAAIRSRTLFAILGVLCLIPICLPDYLLYWAWWQAWPIDSAIHGWAVERGHVDLLRSATLFLGLLCWCWPIAAWLVAAAGRASEGADMLELETRSRLRRTLLFVRETRSELAMAWIILFAVIFNHTTSFDLAQVRTLGYELRAMQSEGSGVRTVLVAALPGALVIIAGGLVVAGMFVRRSVRREESRRLGAPRALVAGGLLVVFGFAIVPAALLWVPRLDAQAVSAVRAGYGRAAANTLIAAGAAGALAGLAAIGLGAAFADRRRAVRRIAGAAAALWVVSAALPAAAIAGALEASYNTRFPSSREANLGFRFDEEIYRSGAIIVLGHLSRFGFVGVMLGWWLARAEEETMRDMHHLDGSGTIAGLWRACWPRWVAAGLATFAIVSALSAGEVGLTSLVQPPGFDAVSAILLNNMHYQRDDMVVLVGRGLMALSIAAAFTAVILIALRGRALLRPGTISRMMALPVVLAATLHGCEESSSPGAPAEPTGHTLVGGPGRSIGQFIYPRAMDIDRERKTLFIIDRSGRVQRFGLDGQPQKQWLMPKYDNGYPTGVTVAPDGRVFVADTHAHCISIFTQDGELLEQFGEFGTGPGQFVFPSDIAFGPEGTIYVSEFGDNDRIQVFSSDGKALFEFGGFGNEPGQLNRPQSMSFNREKSELFVADACNHRIQVFDPEGNLLRILGSVGTEPGKFRYPYGVVQLEDGRVAVTEFGNHRVQILNDDGRPVHVLGAAGEEEGELLAPWASAVDGGDLYVLDSRNSRVQVFEVPR